MTLAGSGALGMKDRDALIVDNQKLARYVARKIWRRGGCKADLEELDSEAFIGLIKAADGFNPEDGRAKFSTFAVVAIERRLYQYLTVSSEITITHREKIKSGECEPVRKVGLTIKGNDGDETDRPIVDSGASAEAVLVGRHEIELIQKWLRSRRRSKALTAGERGIIKMTLDGADQGGIADKLGCTRQYISLALGSAIKKAKEYLTQKKKKRRRPALPIGRTFGPWHHATCEWCGEEFKYRSPLRKMDGAIQYPVRFCSRSCIGQHRYDGRTKLPRSAATLRRLYVDLRMTSPQIAEKFHCEHKSVLRALEKHGIARRSVGRKSTGKCDVLVDGNPCPDQPIRRQHKSGFITGNRCRVHENEYKRDWARRLRAGDPNVGTRALGRAPKPTPCPKCTQICIGVRAARVHCPMDPKRQAWVRRGWETRRQQQQRDEPTFPILEVPA